MSLVTLNNKIVKLGSKLVTLAATPVLPSGVLNFNNASYVELASNPDFSGTKILKWKMWIDSTSANGYAFSLGTDADTFQLYVSSNLIRMENRNRAMGTKGDQQILITTGMTGYVLDCFAYKTTNQFLWFQVGGFADGSEGLGSTGSPPSTKSRFGSDGGVPISNGCSGMYVWDIQAYTSGLVQTNGWYGYGTAPNTSPEWVDTIGSNNGTVMYTSTIKDVTNPALITDWFMPSRNELTAMRTNLHLTGFGGFNNGKIYWTSSETSATNAYVMQMSSGTVVSVTKSTTQYWCRAARKFTAGVGAYNLTDLGPGGGRIFYVDGGTTYYEASPYESLAGSFGGVGNVWSNITNGTSGASGTAIGTGITNTASIIAQGGHIYSAAGACDNLSTKA